MESEETELVSAMPVQGSSQQRHDSGEKQQTGVTKKPDKAATSSRTLQGSIKSAQKMLKKTAAMDDLDDENEFGLGERLHDHELKEEPLEPGETHLPGAERLQNLTSDPAMHGLMRFTEGATTKNLKKTGVDIKIVQRVIVEDEWQMTACLSLPMTMFFFIVFMGFFQQHYSTSYMYLQEKTIRGNLGNAAVEVKDIRGIFGWMRKSLVPYLGSTDHSLGENVRPSLASGEFQSLVGAWKVRTQRSKTEPCEGVKRPHDCHNMFSLNTTGKAVQQDNRRSATKTGWSTVNPNFWGLDRRLSQVDPRSSGAEPSHWHEAFFARLTNLFPAQAAYTKAGTWTKTFEEGSDGSAKTEENGLSQDVKEMDPKPSVQERAPKNLPPAKMRKVPRSFDCRSMKSLTAKLFSRSANHVQPRGRKGRGWRPMGPVRRLLDPTNRLNKLRQVEQLEPSRQLRSSRPEFVAGGWIPWAYVKDELWQYIVPMSMPKNDVISLINSWEQGQLFDRSTKFISFECVLQNDNIGQGVLSLVHVNFLFSRGGHIYVEAVVQSLVLHDSYWTLVFAFVWLCTLIANSIATPARTCAARRRGKLKIHLSRFWNILEWVLTIYGWVIVICFAWERWGTRRFNEQFDDYAKARLTVPSGELQTFDVTWFEKIRDNVYMTSNIDTWLLVNVAYYHLCLILRFFVASRGQPRLAIVVNTMRDSAVDLVHLFFVFGLIWIAYVVAGHILFGKRMEAFSTIEGSMAYTIQIVLQKEFDFLDLTMEDFWTSLIWVYTFVLLVVLVLVNIVLAMIFDTYGEVRSVVTDEDSIGTTCKRIWLQLKLGNAWISNKKLLAATKKMTTRTVTSAHLKAGVPDITKQQVSKIFDACRSHVETMTTHGNKNALPEAIASVLIGISNLQEGVKIMRSGVPKVMKEGRSNLRKSKSKSSLSNLQDALDQPLWVRQISDQSGLSTDEYGEPMWLKTGLLPFIKEQSKFLDSAYHQLSSTEQKLQSLGVSTDICPCPSPAQPWDESADIVEPFLQSFEERLCANGHSVRTNAVAVAPPASGTFLPPGLCKVGRPQPP